MQTWYQRDEASESDDSESDLLRALVRQELFLHYQPVVDLKSGKIIGVEALLRWNHPEEGVQLPKDFLMIAEKGGAVSSIEEWILHTACKQNKKWQEEGLSPFVVSVNISAFPLIQADLV
ncbi:EAL domain-containing protein, partial [Brevibacillus choshinensis]